MHLRWIGGRLFLPMVLLITSCQKEEAPKFVEVKGKVLDSSGKPLTGALLTFHGQEDTNRSSPATTILNDKEGRFRVLCLKGLHKVTVKPHAVSDAGDNPGAVDTSFLRPSAPLPEQFRDLNLTPWSVQVPETGREDVVLRLTE